MAQMLGSLGIGAKVKDAGSKFLGQPVIWKIADKNHAGYPSGAVTLVTERSVMMGVFDSAEPSGSDTNRKSYGNNRYLHSNIRQWLNSEAAAGAWYSAQHAADAPPTGVNSYNTKAGFLNGFSAGFRAALMPTDLIVAKTAVDGGGSETVTDRMFLASTDEAGLGAINGVEEGSALAMFSGNAARVAQLTTEGIADATTENRPADNTVAWAWWLRSPSSGNSCQQYFVPNNGAYSHNYANTAVYAVRPFCNLPGSSPAVLVSDTADGDGCYTLVWNSPPTAPAGITPPAAVYGDEPARVGWGASSDPDGNAFAYRLERSHNGGSYTQIYSGTARAFDDAMTAAMNTVRWRVKAVDAYGSESAYATTATLAVVHNRPPTVSGSDGSLGAMPDPFSYSYTVDDADGDAVGVVEALDGTPIRAYSPQLGQGQSAEVAGNDWVRLANGSHTLTVAATDSATPRTTTRTMTFVKAAVSCGFALAPDGVIQFGERPKRMTIDVIREMAPGAALAVEACNNANDAAPAWEDASGALSGLAHVFANEEKTSQSWGVSVRVRLDRNGSVGNCRIYGIGGDIE
jgi:hypothetical protein